MTLPEEVLDDAVAAGGADEETTEAELAAQRDRLLTLGHRDDDARWSYEPEAGGATLKSEAQR